MPCCDGRDEIEQEYREKQAAKVEAVLCAVVTAFGLGQVIENIDLTECGRFGSGNGGRNTSARTRFNGECERPAPHMSCTE